MICNATSLIYTVWNILQSEVQLLQMSFTIVIALKRVYKSSRTVSFTFPRMFEWVNSCIHIFHSLWSFSTLTFLMKRRIISSELERVCRQFVLKWKLMFVRRPWLKWMGHYSKETQTLMIYISSISTLASWDSQIT